MLIFYMYYYCVGNDSGLHLNVISLFYYEKFCYNFYK